MVDPLRSDLRYGFRFQQNGRGARVPAADRVRFVSSGTALGLRWWTRIDGSRVALLTNVTSAELKRALDPLPADAPALVFCPPVSAATVESCVAQILDALEQAAIDLFPAWLPAVTEMVDSPAAEVAARAAAMALAASAEDFGPFLAELAVSGLRGRPVHEMAIPGQQRAAGLARVITRSVGRSHTALVLELPPTQPPQDEVILTGAARWLAEQGGLSVWLVGGPLLHTDWISSWSVSAGEPELPTMSAGNCSGSSRC